VEGHGESILVIVQLHKLKHIIINIAIMIRPGFLDVSNKTLKESSSRYKKGGEKGCYHPPIPIVIIE
jgi:hypothetical protein